METGAGADPSVSDDAGTYPACRPNISGAGRRRRQRIGYVAIVVSLALLALFVARGTAWYLRALIFLPAGLAAVSLLQVRRNTCIARAAEGTFEHDDFTRTPATDDDVAASRRVAAGIRRDSLLIALACAVLAAITAWV
jgi:hypothetical protein